MIQEYFPLLIVVGIGVVLGFLVVGLGHLFGPRRPTARKSSPYEPGMKPYGNATRRLSVRYYLVAVLFILFDVETVFLISWAVVFRDLGTAGLVSMFVFIGILVVGFVYAWKKGALEWE